jgi:hypothetical protein
MKTSPSFIKKNRRISIALTVIATLLVFTGVLDLECRIALG